MATQRLNNRRERAGKFKFLLLLLGFVNSFYCVGLFFQKFGGVCLLGRFWQIFYLVRGIESFWIN